MNMTPEQLAERLEKAAARVPPALLVAMRHQGEMLRVLIQANASGRPGPNIVTGKYHSSWQVVAKRTALGAQVTVGTEAPQGRRLEFGFTGTDSLGRTYNQPPFPHVGPAVQDREHPFQEGIKRALIEAID